RKNRSRGWIRSPIYARPGGRSGGTYDPVPGRLLYMPASCLPYHITGYTTRTHAIVRSMRSVGADLHIGTRPGYPWDRSDRCSEPAAETTTIDGMVYRHRRFPSKNLPVMLYASLAAHTIEKVVQERQVAAIHAASNHVSALGALIAAKRLGIPFHYEMRGLWELTRISRQPAFEASQAFRQGLELESLVARHADRLFVISEQLGRYVVEHWGIEEERIALLPNCVDPDDIAPADPAQVEPDTIGYAGSLIIYEGLDTLLQATAQLARQGRTVRVRIAGDGEARQDLETLAQRLGVQQQVEFLGRMEPNKAQAMIARCAVVCLPRRPFDVCRIVPPIKLVEALAMAKPVIVPDLPVFRDELGEESPGFFFKAGDADDLARTIDDALSDTRRLNDIGRRARDYAITKRNWRQFVAPIVEQLARG
ncbi:MAG: glycosyltransferase WbuB, partial [Gammaproteobacteria bacterium]